jgi:hypothetical protein
MQFFDKSMPRVWLCFSIIENLEPNDPSEVEMGQEEFQEYSGGV